MLIFFPYMVWKGFTVQDTYLVTSDWFLANWIWKDKHSPTEPPRLWLANCGLYERHWRGNTSWCHCSFSCFPSWLRSEPLEFTWLMLFLGHEGCRSRGSVFSPLSGPRGAFRFYSPGFSRVWNKG